MFLLIRNHRKYHDPELERQAAAERQAMLNRRAAASAAPQLQARVCQRKRRLAARERLAIQQPAVRQHLHLHYLGGDEWPPSPAGHSPSPKERYE